MIEGRRDPGAPIVVSAYDLCAALYEHVNRFPRAQRTLLGRLIPDNVPPILERRWPRIPSYRGEMGRRLRFVPEGGLVEVTVRTVQGRFLLQPGPGWNETFIGVLARAQQLFPVKIHTFVCLGNHAHWMLSPDNARQLAGFMGHVLTNLSKEAARRHGWRGPLFERRYQAILVTDEERAQVDRLTYILRHGAKENLVAHPAEWPGPHCVDALRTGETLRGVWISRTSQWEARNRGEELTEKQASTLYDLKLEPLPCWAHWSADRYQQQIAEILRQIEQDTAERHRRDDTAPLGVAAVLAQHPHAWPNKTKRSPAPLVHAATKRMRLDFYRAYAAFVGAFYEAVARLQSGSLRPGFPDGAFAPPLPLPLAAPG